MAAVVLGWNGRDDTLACLRSLRGATYPELSVVVVDNASTDGGPDAVAAEFPEATLLRLHENRGFAGGVNAGVEAALDEGVDFVLLLNNDATVDAGFLEPLVEATRPGVGAACSQILDADGSRIWYAGADYDPRRGHQGRHTGYGGPPIPASVAPYETDRACGGAMLVPRAAFELVGPLDEALFAYAEDVDWSLRARDAGLRIVVVPASVVRHRVSGVDRRSLVRRLGLLRPSERARRGGARCAARSARRLAPAGRGRRGLLRPGASLAVAPPWAPGRRGRASRRRPHPPRPEGDAVTASLREDPGLWLLLHLRRPGDRRRDRRGTCAVCGEAGRQVYSSWVLSRELARRWGEALATRESLFCERCGCSLRVRRIASVLVDLYAERATTLVGLVGEDAFRALRIAEINSIGRMHPFLAEAPGLTHAEYPEEDIQSLSWEDGSFDLVLTSETLEHVPDPHLALRETLRVLRPGGRHVFTVPVDPSLATSRSRADLPAEHHGRGGGPFALVTRRADMLVHTDFGRDLSELVRAAGFDVETDGDGMEAVVIATRPADGP